MQTIPIEQRIKAAGMRVTAPRLAVFNAVHHLPHSAADRIAEQARSQLGNLSTQAVYDNLHALVEAGLIRRIQPAGHPALFETRTGDNHHHIICRSCGTTGDVDCAVDFTPCLTPSHSHGFTVDEAEVIYWGLCGDCQP